MTRMISVRTESPKVREYEIGRLGMSIANACNQNPHSFRRKF